MKAAVLYDSRQPLVIEERPTPQLSAGEVMVRVAHCGICGSDLRTRTAAPHQWSHGRVLGHEFSGTIVEVGSGVEAMRIGESIVAYPGAGCGHCRACHAGWPVLCPKGRHVMGGFAEYAAMPASCAIPLPVGFDTALGALVEPLAVGRCAVRIANLARGDSALILGAGTIALSVVFWARRLGAGQITILSRSDHRMPIARRFGVDMALPFDEPATIKGAHAAVFDCTGATGMLQRAISHAGFGGKVVSLGSSPQSEPVAPASAGRKAVSLHFPIGYSTADFLETAQTLRESHVDVREMISDVITLNALPSVFESLLAPNRRNKVQVKLMD